MRLRSRQWVWAVVGSAVALPGVGGCSPLDHRTLWVTNYRGEPITVYEEVGGREVVLTRTPVPASSGSGPIRFQSADRIHNVVVRGAGGQQVDRWELGGWQTRQMPHQGDAAYYACSGWAGFEPIAGNYPTGAPRPAAGRPTKTGLLAALGLLGWAATIGAWAWRYTRGPRVGTPPKPPTRPHLR